MSEVMSTISLADLEGGARASPDERRAQQAARNAASKATAAAADAAAAVAEAQDSAKEARKAVSASRGRSRSRSGSRGRSGSRSPSKSKAAKKSKKSKKPKAVKKAKRSSSKDRAAPKRRHSDNPVSSRVVRKLCKKRDAASGEARISGVSLGYLDRLGAQATAFAVKLATGGGKARELVFACKLSDPSVFDIPMHKGKDAPLEGLIHSARLKRALQGAGMATRLVNHGSKGFPRKGFTWYGQAASGSGVSGLDILCALVAGHIAGQIHRDRVLIQAAHPRASEKSYRLRSAAADVAAGRMHRAEAVKVGQAARRKHKSLRKRATAEQLEVLKGARTERRGRKSSSPRRR